MAQIITGRMRKPGNVALGGCANQAIWPWVDAQTRQYGLGRMRNYIIKLSYNIKYKGFEGVTG
jgi:hypothetical protein